MVLSLKIGGHRKTRDLSAFYIYPLVLPYLLVLMSWKVPDRPLLRGRYRLTESAMIARDGPLAGDVLNAESTHLR